MENSGGTETVHSILEPTIPIDVGVLSQRQRIIEAMVASCTEKTYAATTIADLVSRASISRTTFYKRFAGKKECFDAAIDWCIEELEAAAASSHSDSDSPAEAVRKATAATLGLMAANPALAQFATGEAVAADAAVVDRYRDLLIPALEGLWTDVDRPRDSHADPRLAYGRTQVLIYNQIVVHGAESLLDLVPEIVYILLLPFAGHEDALKQARFAGGDASPELGGR